VIVVGGVTRSVISQPNDEGTLVFVVWLVYVAVVAAYAAYAFTFEITVQPDGRIVFRSLLRTRTVPASDIVSIRPGFLDINRQYLVIRHRGGKVRLGGPFEHFYDFLTTLKRLNPSVDTDGL
jgi:hypothetical protein